MILALSTALFGDRYRQLTFDLFPCRGHHGGHLLGLFSLPQSNREGDDRAQKEGTQDDGPCVGVS